MRSLKIYVDSLKHQEEVLLKETLSSDFLNITEKDLKMEDQVHLDGKAYLSNDYLIIHYSARTSFNMPCRICDRKAETPLIIENNYITVSYADIRHGIYDFEKELRESLLLKLPHFTECNNGSCLERKNLEKYLKKTSQKLENKHFPFENI